MSISVSTNRLVLISAAFLTAFANVAFFRNIAGSFAGHPNALVHLISLAVMLFGLLILFLLLFSSRHVLKPALIFLFLVSAVAAYFMDTYNIVIDREMLVNVVSTNASESFDLLTPRFVMYFMLLGLAPSYLIWDIQFQPTSTAKAMFSKLKLAGLVGVILLATTLLFSSFFASFVREHKQLRYYANPITPLYSAYRFGKGTKLGQAEPVKSIGADALIPETDIDRELVIMVVGETARADRFSLNGYKRKTNPRLEQQNVVSFRHVDSCGTSTAISVPCMFDRGDREEFNLSESEATWNALDVLDHAGVSVLWRDNNSTSKGVADRVEFQDFLTAETNPLCDVECRDVGMLSGLQEYVESKASGDIMIVLHQMGSHGPAYYKRYPEEFRVFTPTCESSQLDSCSEEEINNSYDNTILYTDHFLAEVIEFLRKNDDHFETVMLYASDHGESLGENGVYLHGMPYWMAPEHQTDVAMIMWFGKNYSDARMQDMQNIDSVALTHDNLFHTLLGVFEVGTEEYDPTKDVLQLSRLNAAKPKTLVETEAP